MSEQKIKLMDSMQDVDALAIEPGRRLNSATHEEIIAGATSDIYFIKAQEILRYLDKEDTVVTAEIFARKPGLFVGIKEVVDLLKDAPVEIWALPEGSEMSPKEVVCRIKGRYADFGVYETVILGILASSSGWATAARELKNACPDKPVSCFGARHIHPAVAPVMERAAIIGGCDSCSCVLGAKLLGREPAGTTPHALFLTVGDTVAASVAYDEVMPENAARVFLVDTYRDEVEEALRLAEAMGDRLQGVRLDTPSERGGVTVGLVHEMRCRLDMAGHSHVKIFVSGGLTPERMPELAAAGADAFGVGSYISGAPAIDMTMDIKEVNGKPVAKRGRIPGCIENTRLQKMK